VSWTDQYDHDYYEVHLASSQHGYSFGAMATADKAVLIKEVLHGHTYWVKKRSHRKGYRLDEGWTHFSSSVECKMPKFDGANQSRLDDYDDEPSKLDAKSGHEFHVIRESRGDSPDYLQEHNGANAAGEASFLKNHAHTPVSSLALYCVNIVSKSFPHVSTSGGDSTFANYASCQKKGTSAYKCSKINDADCKWLRLSEADCKKARTTESWGYSKKYVGKGWYHSGGYAIYSFPAATECKAGMGLGSHGCTWKRQSFFRLATGHKGMTKDEIEKAFQNVPLTKHSCGGGGLSSHVAAEEFMV